jgi:hypothetical protein
MRRRRTLPGNGSGPVRQGSAAGKEINLKPRTSRICRSPARGTENAGPRSTLDPRPVPDVGLQSPHRQKAAPASKWRRNLAGLEGFSLQEPRCRAPPKAAGRGIQPVFGCPAAPRKDRRRTARFRGRPWGSVMPQRAVPLYIKSRADPKMAQESGRMRRFFRGACVARPAASPAFDAKCRQALGLADSRPFAEANEGNYPPRPPAPGPRVREPTGFFLILRIGTRRPRTEDIM